MDQNVSPSGQVSMKQVVNIPPSPSIRISVIFFQNLYSVGSAFSTMKHSVNLFHIALALTFDAISICFAYIYPNSGPLPPTDPVYFSTKKNIFSSSVLAQGMEGNLDGL